MLDLFSPVIYDEKNVTLSTPFAEGEILEALTSLTTKKSTFSDVAKLPCQKFSNVSIHHVRKIFSDMVNFGTSENFSNAPN